MDELMPQNSCAETFKFYILNNLVMNIPLHILRKQYLKCMYGITMGRESSMDMHCFVTGYNIRIGRHTVVNRFVYLELSS